MIYHLYSPYKVVDVDRHERAHSSWKVIPWRSFEYTVSGLPKIREMVDSVMTKIGDDDLVVLSNFDVGVVCDLADHLRIGYARRRNMLRPIRRNITLAQCQATGEPFVGIDLVCLDRATWSRLRPNYPDLYIGREGWDWVFRFLMGPEFELPQGLVWHEVHAGGIGLWQRRRFVDSYNLHNRAQCCLWAKRGTVSLDVLASEWTWVTGRGTEEESLWLDSHGSDEHERAMYVRYHNPVDGSRFEDPVSG